MHAPEPLAAAEPSSEPDDPRALARLRETFERAARTAPSQRPVVDALSLLPEDIRADLIELAKTGGGDPEVFARGLLAMRAEHERELANSGGRRVYRDPADVPPELERYARMGYRTLNVGGLNRAERRRQKARARKAKKARRARR